MNIVKVTFILVSSILLSNTFSYCQEITLNRVEPPNWWTGMHNKQLQLLVYGKNIAETQPDLTYEGVYLTEVTKLESNHYLFLTLKIEDWAKEGSFDIVFKPATGNSLNYTYTLKSKRPRPETEELTINSSDVIYLITPDRFANGDRANDSTDDTLEKVSRNDPDGRHGGDIKGIIDHLDYLEDLGITTVWLNPFLENDQPKFSYHGYGISDYYKTDPRLGTNEDFLNLVEKCHNRGIKMIMDQVFNHCGSGHWWMNDLPAEDWLNQWPQFTRSSFTNLTISDPYRSIYDYDLHTRGWFDTNLPDLNQNNPYLATYLIQNSIWWIEYAQLDGIRMDTYPYPDQEVMAQWVKTVQQEYPNFYLVGETWEADAASVAYWNREENKDGYRSHLKSTSDYPLYYAINHAFGHEKQIYKLYETLAQDHLYDTPFYNKVFNGNHDQPRLFTELGKDKDKVKLSMAFLLTTRGIPQLYYGDELLFEGPKPDGVVRKDFPGGWPEDERNLFDTKDRTSDENEMYRFTQTILQWRKHAEEIQRGKLKHYKPVNEEVYVYFRYTRDRSTMIILNNGDHSYPNFDLSRFNESSTGFRTGTDILSGTQYNMLQALDLQANQAYIIELNK